MAKKDFVAEAAKAYLEQLREEVCREMIEPMNLLCGSLTSTVAMLTGLSPERIEELGGTGDWEGLIMAVRPLLPTRREHLETRGGLALMTDTPLAGTMQDARLIETEVLDHHHQHGNCRRADAARTQLP